jgi:hypothetical protein
MSANVNAFVMTISTTTWALYDAEDQLVAAGCYKGDQTEAWSAAQKAFNIHRRCVKRDQKITLKTPKWASAQKRTATSYIIPV